MDLDSNLAVQFVYVTVILNRDGEVFLAWLL